MVSLPWYHGIYGIGQYRSVFSPSLCKSLSSFCNSIYGIPWYHGLYGKVDTDLCSAHHSAQVLAISAKPIWFLMVLSWNLLKLGRVLLQATSML
jgi:hypothetical protein